MSRSSRNRRISDALGEAADLLEEQGANPFRVSAYRRAADTVAHLRQDLGDIVDREGSRGLTELPHIGHGIAGAIREMLATGRWAQLDRLRGSTDPERLFQRIPGIGPRLARRIHEVLDVDTLEALEVAAYDGRLESVPGVGTRRVAQVRASLESLLSRRSRPGPPDPEPAEDVPDVETLLDVDREYRERAAAGSLPLIAPRRFNPEGKAWLPVFHASRGRRHFTAFFSNTARAHLGGALLLRRPSPREAAHGRDRDARPSRRPPRRPRTGSGVP